MKRLIQLLVLCFTITFLNASELKHADSYTDAIAQGIKQDKNVVLFAHNPFCPWCKKMEADTLSNKRVIEYLNKNFIFVSVDTNIEMEIEDVPAKFIPRGTPTTYIIDPKTQNKLYSLRGYKNVNSFLGRLKR